MPISFDPRKNERNITQHGLPFGLVEEFEWDSALVVEDTRKEYGERRFQALGLIMGRLHVVVFTPRAGLVHVISLPKANRRDVKPMKRETTKKRATQGNPEWTKATFAKAKPAAVVLPEVFEAPVARAMLKPRGRPKKGAARTSISIRLPPDTLARWKATGPGWQTRMAEALDKAIRKNAA